MDWDDAYNIRSHTPDVESYITRWETQAVTFRERMTAAGRARLDIAYGAAPRERFDLFLPQGTARGLVVFVHGGYWRSFGKSDWSHLAIGPLEHGWAVAMPGYTLCPRIRVSGITRQVGAAIAAAAGEIGGPIRRSASVEISGGIRPRVKKQPTPGGAWAIISASRVCSLGSSTKPIRARL